MCSRRSLYTGKERDAESGLDYFGARYYASNVGRWISADWAQKPEAVPYSKLDDPQSLNLYAYVGNNPLSQADSDGHQWPDWAVGIAQGAGSFLKNTAVGTATLVRAGGGDLNAQASVVGGLVQAAQDGFSMASHPSETLSSLKSGWSESSTQEKAATLTEFGLGAAATIGTAGVGGAAADEADVAGMAGKLSSETGVNSVEFSTETSVGRIDLTGKAHFDKASGESIPTPHVHERQIHNSPTGQTNVGAKTTRPATATDIRNAAKTIKDKNP